VSYTGCRCFSSLKLHEPKVSPAHRSADPRPPTAVSPSVLERCPVHRKTLDKLYIDSLHLTVSEVPVAHISITSAYRRRISLAELVSLLWNVEIWSCREHQRNSTNEVSALPLRSSGTVFRNICARPPSLKDSLRVD